MSPIVEPWPYQQYYPNWNWTTRPAPAASDKHPYLCPVCRGKGSVGAGFYGPSPGANDEKCRSCDGKGVLWG